MYFGEVSPDLVDRVCIEHSVDFTREQTPEEKAAQKVRDNLVANSQAVNTIANNCVLVGNMLGMSERAMLRCAIVAGLQMGWHLKEEGDRISIDGIRSVVSDTTEEEIDDMLKQLLEGRKLDDTTT